MACLKENPQRLAGARGMASGYGLPSGVCAKLDRNPMTRRNLSGRSDAGTAGSHRAGTWTQNFRAVPGWIALSFQSNSTVSPTGTSVWSNGIGR
jgi:hypothetical protein